MSNVRVKNSALFFDFRYRGVRCREYTKLPDTQGNRKRMQKVLDKIEAAIVAGTFDYATFFPGSKLAAKFEPNLPTAPLPRAIDAAATSGAPTVPPTPSFRAFIEDWYTESLPAWRRSHAATIRYRIAGIRARRAR